MFRMATTLTGLLAASSITADHAKCHANLSGWENISTNSLSLNPMRNSTCAQTSARHVGSMTDIGLGERHEQIAKFESANGTSPPFNDDDDLHDEDAKVERFVAWIKEHGGIIDSVKVSTISGYRGVVATRDMKHGDFGITIPEKLFISLISVLEDATLGPIYTANLDLFEEDDYLTLSMFLVHHMHLQNKSFFFPYLSLLPEPETIDNWTDDELSALQDVDLTLRAYRRKLDVMDSYQRISAHLFRKHPEVFTPDMFTFPSFRFAYQTLAARSFGANVQNCSTKFEKICPETVLVPFVDLLNHATHAKIWYGSENRFHWHPAVKYEEGEQVFLTYGNRDNDDLLSYYGFALERNEFDRVKVKFDAEAYAELPKQLESHIEPKHLIFSFTMSTKIEEEILPEVRGLFLPANTSSSSNNNTINLSVPISRELERQALDFVFYHVQQQLESFPTTLEQDESDFDIVRRKQENRPHKLHAALVYRISRKHILQHVLSTVTEAMEHLNNVDSGSALDSLYEVSKERKE